MSFLRHKRTARSMSNKKLGFAPNIAASDAAYEIDILQSNTSKDCRTFIEGDIYQYLFDKYHRRQAFNPFVIVTIKYDYSKHPDYAEAKEVITDTRMTVDFEESPVSFDELMAALAELVESQILNDEQAAGYAPLITEYKIKVNYWFAGPTIDCYGEFPALSINFDHKFIYGKLKKALATGEMN